MWNNSCVCGRGVVGLLSGVAILCECGGLVFPSELDFVQFALREVSEHPLEHGDDATVQNELDQQVKYYAGLRKEEHV